LVGKLLGFPIVKEVRSNIAIQTVKAASPLSLDHLADAEENDRLRHGSHA
jgi:Lrp/AsnC family leucine-responsive transcriptional regulator